MAASRRGQPDLRVDLPAPANSPFVALPDLPPIEALFLIDFDVKAGYTISWKASQPGIELDGVVEYKSLPSGLHTVPDDLIYFVHDQHAGVSAFVNAPVDDSELRNARMLAVGVLVPLSYGRLARAWRHAESLKELAQRLVKDPKDTDALQKYWEKSRPKSNAGKQDAPEGKDAPEGASESQEPQPRRKTHTRNRSASDGAALIPPGHRLSPYHPAWSLQALLDTFGPLIFPIVRTALLRKRILMSCHAPVQEICNFVYDISILANIPPSTFEMLPPGCPPLRLRPLFTVGVHDISFLAEGAKGNAAEVDDAEPTFGWIACTTDSILATRDTLWDMLITMPPAHSANAKEHVWPTVECPKGTPVQATQRDLRRFRALKAGLARLEAQNNVAVESPEASPVASRPPPTPRSGVGAGNDDDILHDAAERIVEPHSWTALAYQGFMWWASAGEQARSDEAEEYAYDSSLLADPPSPTMRMGGASSRPDLTASITSLNARRLSAGGGPTSAALPVDEARVELAIIAYFHRLTTQILTKMVDIVEDHSDCEEAESNDGEDDELLGEDDDDDHDRAGGRGVRISAEALRGMGLDIWSGADADFVREVGEAFFHRAVSVEGKGVEVCGLRVC